MTQFSEKSFHIQIFYFHKFLAVSRFKWFVTGFSSQRLRFTLRSAHVGFVVDKVALE
jgi:hypothetical protein